MNETIEKENSMLLLNKKTDDIIKIISDNMIKTRPRADIEFKPFTEQKGVKYLGTHSSLRVDLSKIYPEAAKGDFAYVSFLLMAPHEHEIFLNVDGNVSVFYEDNLVHEGKGLKNIELTVKEGFQKVEIKCVHDGEKFSFDVLPTLRRYPTMRAIDYLFWMRIISSIEELDGEEGVAVSELCTKNYVLPEIEKTSSAFDFDKKFGEGDYALVYTVAREDGTILITGFSETVAYVNGVKYTGNTINVKENDVIVIKCRKNGVWGFDISGISFHIPFVKSKRQSGIDFLVSGPYYGDEELFEVKSFDKPLDNGKGELIYWQFMPDSTYLRPYLNSVFFGQWFYAIMVGLYGLEVSAEYLGDNDKITYFNDSMLVMAKYFEYITLDFKLFNAPTFMPRSVEMDNLDATGTMGMNFVKAFQNTKNEEIPPVIEKLKEAILNNVPRMSDNTFYRIETMWSDDTYMSCYFLSYLDKYYGNTFYFNEIVSQFKGYKRLLYMENKKLFSHMYFPNTKKPNNVPWGRGNGWVLLTLSQVLQSYSPNLEGYDFLLDLFKNMVQGIVNYQDKTGLWHQVIDISESYLETSCTGMFMIAIIRGVRNGWLPEHYFENAKKAWQGLLEHSIDKDGNVYGVCMGSGCSMEAEYYMQIPTAKNDDHGTGIILLAATELAKED